MKKVLLGLVLGFFLHKGLAAVYNYSWWTAESQCRVGSFEDDMKCVYSKMGYVKYLNYLLLAPNYTYQEWTWK